MKIIHTADLHLDSRIDSLPQDKGKIRRDEILRTFEKLCEYAIKEGVLAVIIAGDAFDTARVSKKTAERFSAAISSAKDTDFLYLSGNHDAEFLSAFGDILPDNFKVFKTSKNGHVPNTCCSYNCDICYHDVNDGNDSNIYNGGYR